MKAKNKKTTFICQISESCLKLVKCASGGKLKKEFIDLETESLPLALDDLQLTEKFNHALMRMGYRNNPIIISLGRSYVTCRYLKVPSEIPEEISQIAYLQAAKFLPYPQEELISGYEVISTDKQGYSFLNLIIAHKAQIERYLKIFKELNTLTPTIVISSFGLSYLYSYLKEQKPDAAPVMVVEFDALTAEAAVVFRNKLLFSRSFKLNRLMPDWEKIFTEELNKTQGLYLKENQEKPPDRILIFNSGKISEEAIAALKKQISLPIESLFYLKKLSIAEKIIQPISLSDNSFASLFGSGLEEIPTSLNLLPHEIKNDYKKLSLQKEYLRLASLAIAAILIFTLAMIKNFDNKTGYLADLKIELGKISKQAEPLEAMEKHLRFTDSRLQEKPAILDILYQLHQIIPGEVSLTDFNYEKNNQIILNGQTNELNSVFQLVSKLENSEAFKSFKIKVRHATQRKTQLNESVDFEIACLKE